MVGPAGKMRYSTKEKWVVISYPTVLISFTYCIKNENVKIHVEIVTHKHGASINLSSSLISASF